MARTLPHLGVFGCAAPALMLTACLASGGATTTTEAVVVTGEAVAGPTCPVEQDPPDPRCAPAPVAGALIIVAPMNPLADAFEVTCDQAGRFSMRLSPGRYTLIPQPVEGLMGTAPPQELEVLIGVPVHVVVEYDTGIR